MRDYSKIDVYLDLLQGDIYSQPPDNGHQEAIEEVIDQWLPEIDRPKEPPFKILDVGCAQGQAMTELGRYGTVTGVTLGDDAIIARQNGFDVRQVDMTFLPFGKETFDLIFARHVIEHSPMPLLTLIEWYQISKHYLLLVVPSYHHYRAQGRNHYYVLLSDQWKCLLERAGWSVVWEDRSKELMEPWEIRWMCQKVER